MCVCVCVLVCVNVNPGDIYREVYVFMMQVYIVRNLYIAYGGDAAALSTLDGTERTAEPI